MIVDGNTYCKIASFGPVLPTEYQEVEYVEGTGTQWIRTQIQIKQNDVLTIIISDISGEGFIYGQNDQGTSGNPLFQRQVGQDAISSRNTFTLSTNNNELIYTFTSVNNPFNGYFGLWCVTYVGNPLTNKKGSGKFYGVKVYRNNTYAYNLIPCYRKSDNEIGMYDTVNKVFYTNQGTGTFLKGNNVVHTIRYKIPTEERPYISGHVTDGSSTFTFTVNGNQSITVPVDSDGNWKWYVDRTITSLASAFIGKENLDYIKINEKLDNVISMAAAFKGCINLELITLCKGTLLNKCISIAETFKNCPKLVEIVNLGGAELKKCSSINLAFDCYDYQTQATIIDMHSAVFAPLTNASFFARMNKGTSVKMNNARFADNCNCTAMIYSNTNLESVELDSASIKGTVSYLFGGCSNLKNLSIGSIGVNLTFNSNSKLTKQSVLNLINAAAANVTYTLHSTVYAKCASGGEWYTDIQAAINAKALEGYTVTLISA